MITIKKDINSFSELYASSWSGAIDTLDSVASANKEEELMNYLSEIFYNGDNTDTELNDYIWFEREQIYEYLGLNENGELSDDE